MYQIKARDASTADFVVLQLAFDASNTLLPMASTGQEYIIATQGVLGQAEYIWSTTQQKPISLASP